MAEDEEEADQEGSLMDLITGYGQEVGAEAKDVVEEKRSSGNEKTKEK